jgi:hypothetical protein
VGGKGFLSAHWNLIRAFHFEYPFHQYGAYGMRLLSTRFKFQWPAYGEWAQYVQAYQYLREGTQDLQKDRQNNTLANIYHVAVNATDYTLDNPEDPHKSYCLRALDVLIAGLIQPRMTRQELEGKLMLQLDSNAMIDRRHKDLAEKLQQLDSHAKQLQKLEQQLVLADKTQQNQTLQTQVGGGLLASLLILLSALVMRNGSA